MLATRRRACRANQAPGEEALEENQLAPQDKVNQDASQDQDEEIQSITAMMTTHVSSLEANPLHRNIGFRTEAGDIFFATATKGIEVKRNSDPKRMLFYLKKIKEQDVKCGFSSIIKFFPKGGEALF